MEEKQQQDDAIHAGEHLLSWEVDEYPRHERSKRWYVIAAIVGVLLIVYSIWTANFMFALIVLMLGIIILLSTFKEPDRIAVILTTNGLVLGEAFYEYRNLKDFAIVYEPPTVKNLYIDFASKWRPLLTIPLEDTDPNRVREAMLPYLKEDLERTGETLTDVLQRVYKL
ncbi:hypothetical protein A2856_00075 [Candidatus Uhrbacteria bacterium RIFCSPHIGHO2_01_FULL_63_20]|uniref:DUF5673 domain-containing protein n=1 Tax=Candidatus Uhrbacteria bacterium RIFCSPHIGHO2_01_FULL_63_20 TaxID=1802385 RepID=A0A1F7TLN7_9BACT|nr:MAG: hypothetical protein A2856_00075 [Candidatus Uhrbacteria bacterium RIFCSPHIGHO2_01_FULL_63_20]